MSSVAPPLSFVDKYIRRKEVVIPAGVAAAWWLTQHKQFKNFAALSTAQPLALVSLFGSSTIVWLCSVILKDVSIVDSFWSLGFLLTGMIYYYKSKPKPVPGARQQRNSAQNPKSIQQIIEETLKNRGKRTLLMIALWAVRLSVYLTWRNYGTPEDYRYRAIRKASGSSFWLKSLFTVFYLQAALCWIISQPLLKVFQSQQQEVLKPTDAIGLLVWVVGFFFETVGDIQLSRFKANPTNKGKLMTSGLWSLTRHPNYFGNACMFWGFFITACANPTAKLTAYAPLLLNYLLLKVSGVSLLEKSLSKHKPGFQEYVESTSAFIPWFKKKN